MLQFSVQGVVPRTVKSDIVHGIISRNTLYGVHRPVMRPDMDLYCTKTTLLFFTTQTAASQFAKCYMYSNPALRRPWHLQSLPFSDVEQLCLLNYLDMYLCFHMMSDGGGSSDGGSGAKRIRPGPANVVLDCYEYKTVEYPNRPILNKIMEDLWRKN